MHQLCSAESLRACGPRRVDRRRGVATATGALELTAKKVSYSGRVQGVGFRYTTQDVARGFAVTGFVRNLRDGTVELLAQGEAGEVDRFLNAVADRLAGNISEAAVNHVDAEPGLARFEIRR